MVRGKLCDLMRAVFSSGGLVSCFDMTSPRNLPRNWNNFILVGFCSILACQKRLKFPCTLWKASSNVRPSTIVSSMYTEQLIPVNPFKIMDIYQLNKLGLLVQSWGIAVKRNLPLRVINAVLSRSNSLEIGIWNKLAEKSTVLKYS
jgi:hypothetical protein